jgi:hypothetical protein
VIIIRSKKQETYGELFFICPNNIKVRSFASIWMYLRFIALIFGIS